MMLGMSLITMTTTTIDLTEGFERLLSPLAKIGFPAHELGMIMGIALRFMPQFADEFVSIYHAQISRGATFSSSPKRGIRMLSSLTIPLFTSAFRRAETLAFAMDARCYHGCVGRTRLHPLHFTATDAIAALGHGFPWRLRSCRKLSAVARKRTPTKSRLQPLEKKGSTMNGIATILEYLNAVPAWYLATSVDGQPHVRPFSFAAEEHGKDLVLHGNHQRRVGGASGKPALRSNLMVARPRLADSSRQSGT